jgi:hypothetical protein
MMVIEATVTDLFCKVCPGCGRSKRHIEYLSRRGPIHEKCAECRGREFEVRELERHREIYRRKHPDFRPHLKRKAAMELVRRLAERRLQKGKGVSLMPEEFAVRLAKLPDRIAAIVGKTYSEKGDSAELADDTAVGMIRDLLNELDDRLIPRNKKKRLSKRA